jgi:ribosomal protein S18 acetylase RimI-like enzyme
MCALSFRRASDGDAASIAALVNACYRGESSRRGWTSEANLLDGTRTDEGEIRTLIGSPDSLILLCLAQETIVGSVHLQREGAGCCLGLLVVRPDLQGGGLGKRLMEAAETLAQETWAVKRMTMTVISARRELIAFYERRGYRRTGRHKPFEADGRHGLPRVDGLQFEVLEKSLDSPPGRPANPIGSSD